MCIRDRPEGIAELKKRMPFADLSKFEDNPAVQEFSNQLTVQDLCRYVESLSAYARQFLGRIKKPDVDSIEGIPPTIAIEQRVNTRNPRSTLGTTTEIYDYLRLLYARIGRTYSPVTGEEVRCHTQEDVLQYIVSLPPGTSAMILAPFGWEDAQCRVENLLMLQQEGYTRYHDGTEVVRTEDLLRDMEKYASRNVLLLTGRVGTADDPDNRARILESVRSAFPLGQGALFVLTGEEMVAFSKRFEADGITFMEPTEHLFNFNNPLGACPKCEGYGKVIGIDEDLVVPNKSLSIYEDAIACWRGESMGWYKDRVIEYASAYNLPIHTPYHKLTEEQKALLWNGTRHFKGIYDFFAELEEKRYKIQYRVLLSRYMGKTTCPVCKGGRLRPEASYVKVAGYTIQELVNIQIEELYEFFMNIELDEHDVTVAKRLLTEIRNRLGYMVNVGLGYLTLNRLSATLSGGESQRINLATSLGSSLVGSLYILDEPSICLLYTSPSPRDS